MEPRKLEGNDASKMILTILKEAGRPLSTREVQLETQKRLVRCPYSTIVFLNGLRQNGVIHGERNREARGWVWWVD